MTSMTEATDLATPDVSVVVPTGGRMDLLDRCLDALSRQTLGPGRYEIIIVDDEPNHHTLHLVAGWRARLQQRGPRLVYVSNAGPHGPAASRNRGWHVAQAPIVAFTDDDTVPTPGWLANALTAFDERVDALCGRVEMPLPATPTEHQREARQREEAEFAANNCFCRKRILEQLGGFDERFTAPWREDADLFFRLIDAGANIVRAPQALVVHPVPPAPWGASLLQVRKFAFDALLYKKHPDLYRKKIQGAPPRDYYATVAALLLALGGLAAGSGIAASLGLSAWLLLTARLCARRLSGTARTVSHVGEILVTSALIPPLAVFWRIAGAIRYRVRFA